MSCTIRRVRASLVVLAAFAALSPTQSSAQASKALNSLGYGVTGAAVGLFATAGATCEGFICIPDVTVAATLGGGLLGGFLGAAISSAANRSVAEDRPIGGSHLAALSIGTLLGGATLGALASSVLINSDGAGTPLGSDEETFALFTLAGTVFGALHLRRNWGRLTGTSVEVRPSVFENGQLGLVTHLGF